MTKEFRFYHPQESYVGNRIAVGGCVPSFAEWVRRTRGKDWQTIPRYKRAEYYGEYRAECVSNGYSYEHPKFYFLCGYW